MLDRLTLTLLTMHATLRAAPGRLRAELRAVDREAGDVPGWVLVTVMSATLIVGILVFAGPALESAFNGSVNNVKNAPAGTTPAGG